jgi:YjbE family integral membrane protein
MTEWLLILCNVMFINIVLSGDNSIVISLAANRLPIELRKKAIVWGSVTAIALRVLLLIGGLFLIEIPFLKIASALLLMWVAFQLLIENVKDQPQNDGKESKITDSKGSTIWQAIRTIAIADLVMSLDNAVAMIGAAKGNVWAIVIGLLITVPVLMLGSQLLSRILQTYKWVLHIAAAILGWTAGEMLIDDTVFKNISFQETLSWIVPILGGLIILSFGFWFSKKQPISEPETNRAA